jgi:hypothetical protein
MKDRKLKETKRSKEVEPYAEFRQGVAPKRARKKPRSPRVRLTHFEIRRDKILRLRIAVSNDALAEVGEELSALIKRAAPSAQPAQPPQPTEATILEVSDFAVTPQHAEHDDDYHAELRAHLTHLFSDLCDTGLETALDIARQERDRRAEGGN